MLRNRNLRKKLDTTLKARVAIEAIRGEKTLSQIASQYEIHVNQVSKWKRQVLDGLPTLFAKKGMPLESQSSAAHDSALYEEIGRLKVELEWLKKKSALLG